MDRYKKQKPRLSYKQGAIIKHTDSVSVFKITVSGLNRAGKKSVILMEKHIQKEKDNLK